MSNYNPIVTHDIDRYYKWRQFKSIFGEFGRIARGLSTWTYSEAWRSFQNRKSADPFSNLERIAEMDANAGLQSVFYIMTTEEADPLNINDYHIKDQDINKSLKKLISMGAEIGIHPGIKTFDNKKKMQRQKDMLEDAIEKEVVRSRQHYLKYEYPTTFHNLESIGIKNDSSILIDLKDEPDKEKRTTYIMKNVDGSPMQITQTPLVFMDTHHMQSEDEEILSLLEKSLTIAKEEGGEVMVLWHNNNISNSREEGLYKEALQIIKGR